MKMTRLASALAALAPALLATGLATPAHAAEWTIDPAHSHLGFSGTQTGVPFQGQFGTFSGRISFDPAHPEAGQTSIVVDIASAHTGDVQRDQAMPQAEWFDIAHFPQARFEAHGFKARGGNAYEASGTLSIRDVTQPLTLPFQLTLDGNSAHATGHVTLSRDQFGVGQGAWKDGQYVALAVDVTFDVVATQAPGK
jgi:polyisoprenoid-binding protein YceI